ncbi:MAG: DMT family transporter [Chitinophagales bacterium]|nr:DMT family transporter [Chitinophagales bacterium]MDW8418817.1 DMT family transporter [Chitinophagales bacterium]
MSARDTYHHPLNWILLFLLTLIWGSSYILIKLGLEAFTAVEVASLRISISFLASLPFLITAFQTIPRRLYPTILQIGIFGSGAPAFLFALSLTRSESSVNGILNSLSPLWTIVVGYIFYEVSVSRLKVAGVLLGFAGAAVLVAGKPGARLNINTAYNLLPVIATFCYGMSTNITKQKLQNVNPLQSTALAMCMIGIPALAIFLAGQGPAKILSGYATKALLSIIILSLAGTLLAWVLFYKLVQRTDALFAASVTYLIPMVAIAWGVYLGETLSPLQLAGMALILIGVYFTTRSR